MNNKNFENTSDAIIRGRIRNLTKERAAREDLFTEKDKEAMQHTALAAAIAGLGDIALNVSASAHFTETVADLITFDLDGRIVRAWIGCSVFAEGDEVEVVAAPGLRENEWIGYAIRRHSDGIIAIHPHCERGTMAFLIYLLKFMLWFFAFCAVGSGLFIVVPSLIDGSVEHGFLLRSESYVFAIGELIAVFITFRIFWRFRHILSLAERIYRGFGWKRPSWIDLPKTSKKLKRPGDPRLMGKILYRYDDMT
ncbi:putative type VI secretion system effector [Robbsia andropogonis]|uniref:putative type VI secretion system effector n=1 Tax=Robbsia andropogonis TaxID=28092 RepID=UPI0020A0502E|nr:putative type VI secretion system effector [Robbsia andropogonis]MCP1121427.1 hypothetical protein [Robbsia andropogonis]MCP1131225.1 hypothetical protein [Robbsia andropogonis]